ncbi:hypothetical protein [Streptomyces pseudogriseolus]|uniref:hypothetical protein n=1 Tax=Streptomyces pseudogriseolus TaxID=36817 RepID=UPI003FA1E03D
MARRSISDPGELTYYLAYAPVGVEIAQLAQVAGSRWAIEECFQAAKNECSLDQYEVRRYIGWYRHITLTMLAHAALTALAAQPGESAKGVAETDQPSSRSPLSHTRSRAAASWADSGGSAASVSRSRSTSKRSTPTGGSVQATGPS